MIIPCGKSLKNKSQDMKRSLLTILTISAFTAAFGQNSIKKASNAYSAFNYSKAITKYEYASKKDIQAERNLAKSYAMTGDLQKAEEHYAKIAAMPDKNADDVYNYAQALMNNKKYTEAQTQLQNFASMAPTDSRAMELKTAGDFVTKIKATKDNFTIKNLMINTSSQDFGTSYYKNQVVFASSRRKLGLISRRWNGNKLPFLDMYVSNRDGANNELSKLSRFKQNKKHHEGPASFTQDGNFMAFTRNDYQSKAKDGVITLELCTSQLTNGKWSDPKVVPFNNKDYSFGHPSLTADGKTMYFSSDMPGGKGGVDIYKVERNGDSWGTPENLKAINTEGNEMFPFVHKDGILFFSSNGHPGLGGLDVFAVKLKNGTPAGKVQNAGFPLNDSKDDFALIVDENQKTGYFSSNREGGKGDDDIYSVAFVKPFKFGKVIKGQAKDKTGAIVADAKVELKDANGVVNSVNSDANGNYEFFVDEEKNYNLLGTKTKYYDGNNTANTAVPDDVIYSDVTLEKDPGLSLYTLVTDKASGTALDGVKIKFINKVTGKEEEIVTPASGDHLIPLTTNKLGDNLNYEIRLEKQGYLPKTVNYNQLLDREGRYDIHKSLDISLEKPQIGGDLGKLININPIYFDLGKYNIRKDAAVELDKVVKVMTDYPTMVVELGSHTDCRSSIASNMKLSDNRAKASAAYIKSRIANPERIYGKGYGESKLLNGCACEGAVKSKCSEEEHQKNRRTEFVIMKM
jgi:outer membrane protein OmpA-like peptidoglycan-associated protein